MSEVKLDRAILSLALPAILSNITVPILGLSDTYLSGHLGSDIYVAAIAAGSMMMNSCFWLFGFLRAGTTGLTAESFGRGDGGQIRRIFTLAFIIAAAIGLILILAAYPIGRLMLWIMSPPSATASLAEGYFLICILGAPALLTTMAVVGWMIGMQNTLYPMIVSISVNVSNIGLSFLFVMVFRTGFYGVANGTLAANWAGLALALLLARRLAVRTSPGFSGESALWSAPGDLLRKMDFRRFFSVNSDLMLRSVCILGVTFGMTSFGGRMGNSTLAVNAVMMQLFLFFSYFCDGFAFSAEALCGRFAGEGNGRALENVVRRLWIWCGGIAVAFSAIYYFGIGEIAYFLTDSAAISGGVESLAAVIGLIPLLSAAAFLYDGIYIGLTATRSMLWLTFAGSCVFFASFGVAWLLDITTPEILNPVLWGGFLGFLLVRGAGLIAYSHKVVRIENHELEKRNQESEIRNLIGYD